MKVLFLFALVFCYVAATGQWEKVDTDDDEILEVVRYAAKTVNERFKSRYHHKLVDFLGARKQVVAGMNYEVKITLRETTCSKVEKTFEEANDCDFKDGSILKYCTVRVWDKPWLKHREVTHYSCSSKPFN